MRTYRSSIFVIAFILFVSLPGAHFPAAGDTLKNGGDLFAQKSPGAGDAEKKPVTKSLLNYKPPLRGTPGKRVGGATRGVGDDTLHLAILSPDHTALTTESQPSLFWFISKPTPIKIEIAINDEKSVNPVMEKTLDSPSAAGIQRLRLSDYGISLQPGVEYQWFISLVVDPEHRSQDVVDSGLIQRIEPSRELAEELGRARGIEAAAIYAREGIWYDALSAISDLIEKAPGDAELIAQRDALLEQGGLTHVLRQE